MRKVKQGMQNLPFYPGQIIFVLYNLSMNRKRYLFLFALLFSTVKTGAQNDCKCAEEERLRPQIIQFFNAGKVDAAVALFQEIRRTGLPACRISYCNSMAQYYFNRGETSSVPRYMREEKHLLDSTQCSPQAYARFYNTYGNFYLALNQYQKSADFFLKAARYAEQARYDFGQQRAFTSLGVVFSQMEQYQKSILYGKKAEQIARKLNNLDEVGIIRGKQASAYNSLYEQTRRVVFLDSAKMAAQEALQLGKNYQNVHTLTEAHLGMAYQYFYQKNWVKGLHYADSALLLLPRDFHHLYKYQALLIKSQIHQQLNRNRLAANYADSALLEAELFNPQMQVNALKQVHSTAKKMGNYSRALLAHERMSVMRDSLASMEKFSRINELEQQYQKIKNEKTIQELSQSRRIAWLRAQQLGLGIAVALLVIVILMFLLRQRNLQAKQATLEKEQRLNRARMNPHFFFNALVALQVLAMRTNDGRSIALYLSKFASIMRQILESTYLEYVSLAQEKAFLEKYLELQSLRFPASFEYSIVVEDGLDSEHLMLPPMLIQPIAENAIEHGFRQKDRKNVLQIRFVVKASKQLVLEIEDNGQGLTQQPEQKKTHLSRASQIIQDTLSILRQKHQCDAHFKLLNKPEGGVLAQIFLPLIVKAG